MPGKLQNTSLSGKKLSGLPVQENFGGGLLLHRSGLALNEWRNGTAAVCLPFSRNPEAQKWNSVKKCVSGIRGGACFTLNNMGAFPIM
jgi:hypothetical protein